MRCRLATLLSVLTLLMLVPACATIRTEVRREERVLATRSDVQHSRDWSYEASSQALDADAATAQSFRAEISIARVRQCWDRTTESVQVATITDREWQDPTMPIVEWAVGGACTIASVVAFSFAPPTQRDPMTGELRFTPSGLTGFLTGICGLSGVIPGVADLVRIVDLREDAPTEGRVTESEPRVCESEPAAGVEVELVARFGGARAAAQVVARGTADASGVAMVEVGREALFLGGSALTVRIGGTEVGPLHALDAAYATLRRIAEEEEEREREEEIRSGERRAARARLCQAMCSAANGSDFAIIDREPRVLEWMNHAFQATRTCRSRMGGAACTPLFVHQCAGACLAAPATDPTATLPPRSATGSATTDDAIARLASEGIAGFRIGANPDDVRAQCAALSGTLDESAFGSEHEIGCDGHFAAVVDGQPLPVVDGVTVRFCGRQACALTITASSATAGRAAILAYRDALSDAVSGAYGVAPTRETRGMIEGRRWTIGRRVRIEMLVGIPRATRDMTLTAGVPDTLMLTFAVGAGARR